MTEDIEKITIAAHSIWCRRGNKKRVKEWEDLQPESRKCYMTIVAAVVEVLAKEGDKMGGRYLITGTELALLGSVEKRQAKEILREIEANRFITDSDRPIAEDVKMLRHKAFANK